MYILQLANCLGACKLQANKSDIQFCFDVSTSFVIFVTRLLTHTIPYARDDKRILLSTLYANTSADGSYSCTILATNVI